MFISRDSPRFLLGGKCKNSTLLAGLDKKLTGGSLVRQHKDQRLIVFVERKCQVH